MIERKVKTVRALERGLQVLSEIDRRKGANLHELHLALGLPKAVRRQRPWHRLGVEI